MFFFHHIIIYFVALQTSIHHQLSAHYPQTVRIYNLECLVLKCLLLYIKSIFLANKSQTEPRHGTVYTLSCCLRHSPSGVYHILTAFQV